MSAFTYTATDSKGRTKRGVLEASSAASARDILRDQDLLPIEIQAARDKRPAASAGSSITSLWQPKRLGPRDLALVVRQLATLLASGVTTEKALSVAARQLKQPRASAVLMDLRSAVVEGASLSAAMDDHPKEFPDALRAAIRAGERAGRLADVLNRLADFVENSAKNSRKVGLALIYPALLALVASAMVIGLLTFVVPDIVVAFESRNADLPLLTRALIGASEGLQMYGLWMGLALAVTALVLHHLVRANRLAVDKLIYTRPPIRGFAIQLNSARFATTMATLVQSGAPVLDALQTAAGSVPNHFVRARLADAARRVREGASLGAALIHTECFSPLLVTMVESGESGGDLGDCLARAAKDEQEALDQAMTTFVSLIEPAVLLTMGVIVLVLVLAILSPIVALNDLAAF